VEANQLTTFKSVGENLAAGLVVAKAKSKFVGSKFASKVESLQKI
jgi:hypothetical protein